jgi:hypothetical protein
MNNFSYDQMFVQENMYSAIMQSEEPFNNYSKNTKDISNQKNIKETKHLHKVKTRTYLHA